MATRPKKFDVSFLLIVIMFVAAGIISWRVYFKVYRQADSVNIHHFPRTIGNWVSEDLPISDDEKALLETDNVFVRRYTNPQKEEVFLFIVYSQSNRKVSHPPEICYTGGGATILNSIHDVFRSIPGVGDVKVNLLTVERGDVTQIFAYWFRVGDSFMSNYWAQQGLIALNSFLGRPASSALIRVSSTVHHEDHSDAIRLIREFSHLTIPYLQQNLP